MSPEEQQTQTKKERKFRPDAEAVMLLLTEKKNVIKKKQTFAIPHNNLGGHMCMCNIQYIYIQVTFGLTLCDITEQSNEITAVCIKEL